MQIAQKNFYKKLLGRAGEKEACKYLKKQGYKILENNYKTPFGEADIIAFKEQVLVFVEVKTRSGDEYGTPAESVTLRKQERYIRLASVYSQKDEYKDVQCRFDVIEIENGQINHIIDAFSM